jgi:outer membrane lipoprotein-sorting protein
MTGAPGSANTYIGQMKKILLGLCSFALLALPLQATAEKLSLAEISSYLNGLKTVQAEFTQINDDGTIATGDILIRRPGRIRFEYDPPDKSLVVAGQGQVAVFDAKSNQPPERFPLTRTPLNLILAPDIDLGTAEMVVGHSSDATTTTVVVQDPKYPEIGYIQLIFTADPVELRQWVVTDGAGGNTTLTLGEMKTGMFIRKSKFDIDAELASRGF